MAARMPSAPNANIGSGSNASAIVCPRKKPAPRSGPNRASASHAKACPARSPATAPTMPSKVASPMTQPTSRRLRESKRSQQREVRTPPGDCQRLRREHEHAAREKRHQREHVQVDAIGARQPGRGCRAVLGRRDNDTGRQQCAAVAPEREPRPRRVRAEDRYGSAARDTRTRPGPPRCPSPHKAPNRLPHRKSPPSAAQRRRVPPVRLSIRPREARATAPPLRLGIARRRAARRDDRA